MPDTKILKTNAGWIDLDDPNTVHRVRRLARDARRARLGLTRGARIQRIANRISGNGNVIPMNVSAAGRQSTNVTTVAFQNSNTGAAQGQQTLTSLQDRLFTRLTTRQGVSTADALDIILNNGYNKAASYGHMREAGATHSEAVIVIALDSPEISEAYGILRAKGDNHTDALRMALTQKPVNADD